MVAFCTRSGSTCISTSLYVHPLCKLAACSTAFAESDGKWLSLQAAACRYLLLGAGWQAAWQGLLLQGIRGQQSAVTLFAPISLSHLCTVPLQALWWHQLPREAA